VGYIACGSTNDFAASIHLPSEPAAAAGQIAASGGRRLDVGLFNDRHFMYVASFGAFTKVSYATPQQIKNTLGHFAYVLEGMKELSRIQGIRTRVMTDEGESEGEYIFGMLSNTTSVGGFDGFHSGLQVDLKDGLLEVILLQSPKSITDYSALLGDLVRMNMKSRFFTVLKARKISFSFLDTPPEWTLDGEFGGAPSEVEILALPQAYSIIVPSESREG
jgi:diacylglycerol kinase family enzyme